MAELCDFRPTLPREATGDDEICDRHGNRWIYDAESNGWISKGTINPSDLVSEDASGLVTPDIFDRLRKLETYSLRDIKQLKLLPGTDAYWYYFKSSDKLFRFRQEGENALRIEVDKGRIFQILMKEVCPGVRGPKGLQGDTGLDGIHGADEICYEPSEINDGKLDFAIFTPTPLLSDTAVPLPGGNIPDISVRIYPVIVTTTPSRTDQLNHLAIYFNNNDPRKEFLPKFQATRDLLLRRVLGDVDVGNLCDIPLSPVALFPSDSEIDITPVVTVGVNPEDPTQVTIDSSIAVDEQRTLESSKFYFVNGVVCC